MTDRVLEYFVPEGKLEVEVVNEGEVVVTMTKGTNRSWLNLPGITAENLGKAILAAARGEEPFG
jgi:hypothetical protein